MQRFKSAGSLRLLEKTEQQEAEKLAVLRQAWKASTAATLARSTSWR